MRTYVLKRLLLTLPVLLGICTVVFFLSHLIPGDAVDAMLGTDAGAGAANAAALRHYMGLDQPIGHQYLEWLGNLLQGDMGKSLFSGRPVAGEITSQFPATLQLAAAALVVSLAVAIPVGVVSAAWRNSWFDNLGRVLAMLGVATPNFWLGVMLILTFALWLRWLPSGGHASFLSDPWQSLRYLILPAVTLGTGLMAETMRMTRSAMLEVIRQDYIRTAHAKGSPRSRVLYRHALRNALIPVVTLLGIQAGRLLGGTVVIESVFSRPGAGRLALLAIGNRDYPMVQGTVLFVTVVFVLVNLTVDVLYAYIDPRIRYQ